MGYLDPRNMDGSLMCIDVEVDVTLYTSYLTTRLGTLSAIPKHPLHDCRQYEGYPAFTFKGNAKSLVDRMSTATSLQRTDRIHSKRTSSGSRHTLGVSVWLRV